MMKFQKTTFIKCAWILLAAPLSQAVYADTLNIVNAIKYGSKEQLLQHGDIIPSVEAYISINDKEESFLLSSEGNDVSVQSIINTFDIRDGDSYSLKVKAIDGEWYHTKPFKYDAKKNGSIISIEGGVLPQGVYANGEQIATFYNANDWPSTSVTCMTSTVVAGEIVCDFEGPNLIDGFKGTAYSTVSVGIFTGTGYFNPDVVKEKAESKFVFTQAAVYANMTWMSAGNTVGYANFGGLGVGVVGGSGRFASNHKCPSGTTLFGSSRICDVGDIASSQDVPFIYGEKLFISTDSINNCPSNTIDNGVYGSARHCYYNKVDLSKYNFGQLEPAYPSAKPFIFPFMPKIFINPYLKSREEMKQ
ncbi:hypothetical protein JD508_20140 [Aeromonas jandaei]|uniref:hypothetical protein n=1 Tax=Aeromonas jandaei TaxID=650 RepID=UPI00191E6791|nr:hypothetical protein [Aeromonas jandaei]MBL0612526.1 hypothetical protein [Aeromonas jandaei]